MYWNRHYNEYNSQKSNFDCLKYLKTNATMAGENQNLASWIILLLSNPINDCLEVLFYFDYLTSAIGILSLSQLVKSKQEVEHSVPIVIKW